MTYKDTLFFIGKALTINHVEKNKEIIETQLKEDEIDWDAVVKVSTAHYVFPALYCNLKRANFLHYLPKDLVGYMKHITDLNRKRNQQIIEQAKEINELLLANNITPIFLKGTGNLLEGLYEDIAERMVGDIDFIINMKDYKSTINLLLEDGYKTVVKEDYLYPIFRHFARLYKEGHIGAIEIHKELIKEEYKDEFNYELIQKKLILTDDFYTLNNKNKLSLTIIAKQINDNGKIYKNISLRNAYDLFLLSNIVNAKETIASFNHLKKPLNNFLAISYTVFNELTILKYHKTKTTERYLKTFHRHLNHRRLREMHIKKTNMKLFIKERLNFILNSFFSKEHRIWIYNRLKDKNWQKEKLFQLGVKKRI